MVQSSRVLAGEVVSEGFLGAALMAKLLDPASPKEVVRDVLMTLSNLSRMNKVTSITLSVGSLLFLPLPWVVLMSSREVSFGILDLREDHDRSCKVPG